MYKRYFLSTLLVIFFGNLVFSQNSTFDYGNSWYVADPLRPFIKLKVAETGVYRVYFQDLLNAGHDLSGINVDHLQLFFRGEEQRLFVQKNGLGEWVSFEFFAFQNDGVTDTVLYRNPLTGALDSESQPTVQYNLFSDTAVYFLTWAGVAGLRYNIHSDTSYSLYTPVTSYPFKTSLSYRPGSSETNYINGGGGVYDMYYRLNPDYVTGEGYVGPSFEAGTPLTVYMLTPQYASTGNPLQIETRVLGASNTAHRLRLELNGNALTPVLDTLLSDIQVYLKTFQRAYVSSLSTLTSLTFYALNFPTDFNYLIETRIKYDRLCDLDGEVSTIISGWENNIQKTYFRFTNSNGQDSVWAYDLENGIRHTGRIKADQSANLIIDTVSGKRDLFIVTDADIHIPVIAPSNALSNLCHPDSGAEYLIITHRDLASSAYAFANYRDTCSKNSFSVKVIFTDQIYDEFGYGSLTPWAIKRFVNCAYENWNIPPKYVLLWGKGGFKLRTDEFYVPTYGYPFSDFEFVSGFDKDTSFQKPFMPIGRVGIINNQDGLAYLSKVDEFEHTGCEDWRRRGIFIGGGATSSEQAAIASSMNNAVQIFSDSPFYGIPVRTQKGDTLNSLTFQQLTDTIGYGAGIIHILGHSVSQIGGDDPVSEPEDYGNFGRYPLFVSMSGLGMYSTVGHSWSERWLLEPDRGVIAFLGNSTISYLTPLKEYIKPFYERLFIHQLDSALGDVVQTTFHLYTDSLSSILFRNTVRQINLFGDPSLVITPCTFFNFADPVWPGDANSDGIADISDLLNIGLAYGESGPARTDTSINWYAHESIPWDSVFTDSVNYKHTDANGDGLVNARDTLAILQNYGLTHNKGDNFVIGGTPLMLVYPSNVQEEDTVTISVFWGDSTQTDSLYGIVFSLAYDPDMIKENSLWVDANTSWLGTEGLDMIVMHKDHFMEGKVDIGLTRINHTAKIGYGKLADITIVITDDLAKKDWGPFQAELSFGRAVTPQGFEIPVEGLNYSQGVEIPESYPFVRIYPNPALSSLTIEPNGSILRDISLVNITGQIVLHLPTTIWETKEIEISHLAAGVYWLTYRINEKIERVKIFKR